MAYHGLFRCLILWFRDSKTPASAAAITSTAASNSSSVIPAFLASARRRSTQGSQRRIVATAKPMSIFSRSVRHSTQSHWNQTPRLTRRRAFLEVRSGRLLGAPAPNFCCNASIEIVLPVRTSFLALSMTFKNSRLVLNARDSRSAFLSETRAATGLFFLVKTSVSSFAASATFRNDWISFGSFIAFISVSPCLQ